MMREKKKATTTAGLSPILRLIIAMGLLIGLSFVLYLFYLPSQQQFQPGKSKENNNNNKDGGKNNIPQQLPDVEIMPQPPQIVPKLLLPEEVDNEIAIMDRVKELFDLGKTNPSKLAEIIQTENPFNLPETPDLFICPTSPKMRISSPELVNHTRAAEFREGKPGTWLFYQHLRKAGGTGFCDLAQNNLPRRQTPPYYCMIDNRGSLATAPWNNEEYLMSRMEKAQYRITANEWDAYYPYMGQWRGAVLATTFRHPVDRWYSQYRFEHLEHRDGSKQDAPRRPFRTWYNNNKGWTMGINYYVTTFIGAPDLKPSNKDDFYWTYHKYQNKPMTYPLFLQSLQNILTFHLVLVTEWLDSSPPLIEEVLGWKTPPKPVLPHESNAAKRESGYRKTPIREVVGDSDYNFVLQENIFDLLLFQIVKRIYLERLHHC